MIVFMERTEILKILMPERTKQIALAWSILRQSHLSEDVYQDMLAKVLENKDIFEGPQHLCGWSWRVLRNRCYELIRERKYQVVLLDDSILDLVDVELERRGTTDMPMRVDALHDCLGELSENSRQTSGCVTLKGCAALGWPRSLGESQMLCTRLCNAFTSRLPCALKRS